MSTANPSGVHRRRRWIVGGLWLLLLPAGVFALYEWRVTLNEQELVSEIEAAHGGIVLETSAWDRWVGEMVQEGTGIKMYRDMDGAIVRLDGALFDNTWIRDHDYLRAMPITTLTLNKSGISGSDLALLVGSHPLRELYVADVDLPPEVFDCIIQQHRLKLLHLRGARLKDDQFIRLPLEQMEQLYVEETQVTPAGLQDLRRCDQLSYLGLDGRQLDDGTAALLLTMPNLCMLNVVGGAVTDEHIQRLHGMPNLGRVMLVRTSVTREGVEALRAANPGCIVSAM